MLFSIAKNILFNEEDANESVNDTYLNAWNSIPPNRPNILPAFLGKITRHISLNKLRSKTTEKRGSGEAELIFEELEECIPSIYSVEREAEAKELGIIINGFIKSLPDAERRIFICRYWYLENISDISKNFGFSKSKVKTLLFRTRKKLLSYLEEEGVL